MGRKKYVFPVFAALLFLSFFSQAHVNAETVSRRNIDVTYAYQPIEDSFGNVRKILVNGTVRNTSMRMASKVTMTFTFLLKNRAGNTRKIDIENLASMETQSFNFTIDFSVQPVTLKSIICNIDQITFSAAREASPLTPYHMVVHELYSLARLNEEGKAFLRVLKYIREIMPFVVPAKDEFETTSEYEARVNNAENQHFSALMDELEKRYGLLFGGANTRIRFLPRTMKKNLIYVSECSAYFHVPIAFGPYNADVQQFENVLMNPRTFPFAPQTHVPDSDLQFIHRSGMFFLRTSDYAIERSEAKTWREQDRSLILEVTIRFGVKQDGSYLQDFCVVEKIVLKNKDSGEVFREWQINP
jgi:hypothetical protein